MKLGPTQVGWARWPGSVLMVHQDSKDISPKQAEALHDFAHSRLQPLCGGSIDAGPVTKTKQEFIDWMTKKKNYETFSENLEARVNGK